MKKKIKPAVRKKTAQKKAARSTDLKDENTVLKEIASVSVNARKRAYRKNASVTVIRNGKILRLKSKEKPKLVGVVKRTAIKVDTTKTIRIK